MPSAVIFGARNLGRAIIETLVEQGWAVAGTARSDETLAAVTTAGALALPLRALLRLAAKGPELPFRTRKGKPESSRSTFEFSGHRRWSTGMTG